LRIKNNWKLEFEEQTGLIKVGASDHAQAYRVINQLAFYLKSNLKMLFLRLKKTALYISLVMVLMKLISQMRKFGVLMLSSTY